MAKLIQLRRAQSPGRDARVLLEGRLVEDTMMHELVYAVREGLVELVELETHPPKRKKTKAAEEDSA